MGDTTYNGYTNKYTWITNMLLDVELCYEFISNTKKSFDVFNNPNEFKNYEVQILVEYLKELISDKLQISEITDNILKKELLQIAYSQIDFYQLALTLIEDYSQV